MLSNLMTAHLSFLMISNLSTFVNLILQKSHYSPIKWTQIVTNLEKNVTDSWC